VIISPGISHGADALLNHRLWISSCTWTVSAESIQIYFEGGFIWRPL